MYLIRLVFISTRNSAIKTSTREDGTVTATKVAVKRVVGKKRNTIPDEILNNAALQYAIKSVNNFIFCYLLSIV